MARQKLGQHFLTSPKVLERIAAAACSDGCPLILEIGPGKGALTERLLERGGHVIAIELDPDLPPVLRERFPQPNFQVLEADALSVDFDQWPGAPITGNLPYYVATPIIEKVVRLHRDAVFLIQKEVAERIASGPGSREYGYLSVMVQLFAKPELLFKVAPGCFQPPPKVESAVIRLTPQDRVAELGIPEPDDFLRFLGWCFQHKRKTLRNNLVGKYELTGFDLSKRAEQLTLAQFAELYRQLTRKS